MNREEAIQRLYQYPYSFNNGVPNPFAQSEVWGVIGNVTDSEGRRIFTDGKDEIRYSDVFPNADYKNLCDLIGLPRDATDDQIFDKVYENFGYTNVQINIVPPSDAPSLLTEAAETIGNRASERDTKAERSMAATVAAFNAMFDTELTEEQGWQFMVLLKMSRSKGGKYRRDDYVDGAAYFALAGESAAS